MTSRLVIRLFAAFAGLLLHSAAHAAPEAIVGGRILTENGSLEGGMVYAYRSHADIQSGLAAQVSAPADTQGRYGLNLSPGEYFFVARGNTAGKNYFAYHGSNPIKIDTGKTWVTLLANEIKPPSYAAGPASLKGTVTYKGQPVKGAFVSIYKQGAKLFKGLGLRTESGTTDGSFDVAVAPGRYVVIAKKSESGKGKRPLKKGDLYCYYPGNPVDVGTEGVTGIEVPCYPKNERNDFVDTPPIKPEQYKTIVDLSAGIPSGIRGKVTDSKGNPVEGILVLAYRATKPVFLTYYLSHGTEFSAETDSDGRYSIPVGIPGDYYIVARNTLGDGPHRGELYGLYNGNSRHVASLGKDQVLEGIDITVSRIIDEPRNASLEVSKTERKTDATVEPAASGDDFATITDRVITADTVWKGRVVIEGVVVVKKEVTLTILPGTHVRFRRLDRDNNGVGDGELRVEGRIIARGTVDKPIVFSSAEAKMEAKDWSHVHLLASQADNVFEYCRFEHAFSGIQTHYSNARISDCLFTGNNEGLYFNTSDVVADHNTFERNGTGIRFKRLEGKVVISANEIRDNEVGVLFGRQQINTVDFGNLHKPTDLPLFFNNNFYNNKKYNFSFGQGQDVDLSLSNNWWGTSDASQINAGIFDHKRDATLGRADYSPFLTSPVAGAGIRDTGMTDNSKVK